MLKKIFLNELNVGVPTVLDISFVTSVLQNLRILLSLLWIFLKILLILIYSPYFEEKLFKIEIYLFDGTKVIYFSFTHHSKEGRRSPDLTSRLTCHPGLLCLTSPDIDFPRDARGVWLVVSAGEKE